VRPRAQQAHLLAAQHELVEREGGLVTVEDARLRAGVLPLSGTEPALL